MSIESAESIMAQAAAVLLTWDPLAHMLAVMLSAETAC